VIALLTAIVDIAGTDDHNLIVRDEDFRVYVQLLLEKSHLLAILTIIPRFLGNVSRTSHSVLRNGILRRRIPLSDLEHVPLIRRLLLFRRTLRIVMPRQNRRFMRGDIRPPLRPGHLLGVVCLGLVIRHTRLFLPLPQTFGDMQPVVGAKIEDKDVFRRIDPLRLKLAINGVFAAVDGFILIIDDGTGSQRRLLPQVPRETRDGGNDDDDAKLPILIVCASDGIDDGFADLVAHGLLFLACGGDEELVLDVDEMLRVLDDRLVGGLDAIVFGQDTVGPVGGGAHDLDFAGTAVLGREVAVGVEGVLDVAAEGEGGALDASEVVGDPAELEPRPAGVAFVLVALEEIPPLSIPSAVTPILERLRKYPDEMIRDA